MFIVVKKKNLIIVFVALALALALTGTGIALSVTSAAALRKKYTVVIDAGHGGIDAGVTGVNSKVKESDLNLDISGKLKIDAFIRYIEL